MSHSDYSDYSDYDYSRPQLLSLVRLARWVRGNYLPAVTQWNFWFANTRADKNNHETTVHETIIHETNIQKINRRPYFVARHA